MIITCPHCQTKYQVTYDAIGSAGRKVQCAHCQQAWQQQPASQADPVHAKAQQAFEAILEDGLDEALISEEKAVATELAKRLADEEMRRKSDDAAKLDPAVIRRRQRAFSKRQDALNADQPLARLRRASRFGLVLTLLTLVAGAYAGRVAIVERYPALAGLYEAVGIDVNVVGLDFSNVTTMRTVRDGKDLLTVSAQIVGLAASPTMVPPVVVTLLDPVGAPIYAWSITPLVEDLMAGERATFDTQLVLPPGEAATVRLSFADAGTSQPAQGQPTAASALGGQGAPIAVTEHLAPAAAAAEHTGAAAPEHLISEHH